MTQDWIRQERSFGLPVAHYFEGDRVVEMQYDELRQEYILLLDGGRFRRVTPSQLQAAGPIPRFLMANEKDDTPRGLSLPPAKNAPPAELPRGLAMPVRPAPSPRADLMEHAAPSGLTMPSKAPDTMPGGLKMPTPPVRIEGDDLKDKIKGLPTTPVHRITVNHGHAPLDMNRLVARPKAAAPAPLDMDALVRRPAAAPRPPGTFVVGGDPRVPAMLEKAKTIDLPVASDQRFHGRLQFFLDQPATIWATWADKDVQFLVSAASTQAKAADALRLANAVEWASKVQEAYSKPPGFLDRFNAPRPDFFRTRLEQSRDELERARAILVTLQDELKVRLATVRLDALVLQVATENVPDPSNKIIAQRRHQTLVQGQTTGSMILAAAEQLAMTCANQTATVSDLLTVTIPNWIMALSKR